MASAVLHPNGFYVKLLASLSGFRVRFHYWPKASVDKSPHNHRSWFLSLPLWGSLTETRYEEVPGDVYDKHACGVTPGNGSPVAEPAGTGNLNSVSEHTRRTYVPYFCSKDTIHSVASHGRTLTLVLFGPSDGKRRPLAWDRRLEENHG